MSILFRLLFFRFSKTHHVFANSGGNPGHLSALSRCVFKKLQCLPAIFAFWGVNPGVTPPIRSRRLCIVGYLVLSIFKNTSCVLQILEVTPATSQHFRAAFSSNCHTSRLLWHFWGGNPEVTPRFRLRRLFIVGCLTQ